MALIGIDPGLDGALAWVEGAKVKVWDMPVGVVQTSKGKKRVVDPVGLMAVLGALKADFIVLEKVWAMPRQGVASSFTFGKTAGAIEAVVSLSGMPWIDVPPQKWKADLLLLNDKDKARAKCSELFPACAEKWARKKDHNRAEAVLLAYWGREFHGRDG